MKNQGNIPPPKDHNNFSVTSPKDPEICDLPVTELKIALCRNSVSYKKRQKYY